MSNTNNFEMPHIELTGLSMKAVLYRHTAASPDGRDMFGIMFYVKATKPDSKHPFGETVRVNYPMNCNDVAVAEFEELVREKMGDNEMVKFTFKDNVVVEELCGVGIRAYVRMVDIKDPYPKEYYVNEQYKYELTDEPILMDELPDVPLKSVVSNKAANGAASSGRRAMPILGRNQ